MVKHINIIYYHVKQFFTLKMREIKLDIIFLIVLPLDCLQKAKGEVKHKIGVILHKQLTN